MGLPNDNELFFRFEDGYLENDITGRLGIDQVETAPTNAQFYINDTLHTAVSNRISLNHSMDLDLMSTSKTPVNIYLVPDEDKIATKLTSFVNSYNQLVDIARHASSQRGATKLMRDITGIARRNREALESVGLTINENGYLDKTGEADSAQIKNLFNNELSGFSRDLQRTTEKMTLNPLDYIDKVVVTYPNNTGTYPNPYNPSKYSGLLFNDYA